MSIDAVEQAQRTQRACEQRTQPMDARARRGELLVGGGFISAATALALFGETHRAFSLQTTVLYVLLFAAAGHIRFDVGGGFTVPTQAVFVPMLFAIPLRYVPLLVALSLAVGAAPRILSGSESPSWLRTIPGNSWFSLGPVAVLLLAGEGDPARSWGILVAAFAAQALFDLTQAVAREQIFDGVAIRELLDELVPIYAIDLALSGVGLLAAIAATAHDERWPVILIAPLFGVLWLFSKERSERLQQLVELTDAYQGTALLLGDVVEADDSYTGEHSKGVVRLALNVAAELGLSPDRCRAVEFGALLHDVGKIAVPSEIINKPGALDSEEWEIIKTHTIEGQKMLERIGGLMRDVGVIVRASHERWDGTGYPDGLRGEEIPLEARVVSACDAFSAMTTTRSYRKAIPMAAAVAELRRCAGAHFDPRVVQALIQVSGTPQRLDTAQGPVEVPPAILPAAAPERVRSAERKLATATR